MQSTAKSNAFSLYLKLSRKTNGLLKSADTQVLRLLRRGNNGLRRGNKAGRTRVPNSGALELQGTSHSRGRTKRRPNESSELSHLRQPGFSTYYYHGSCRTRFP